MSRTCYNEYCFANYFKRGLFKYYFIQCHRRTCRYIRFFLSNISCSGCINYCYAE